MPRFEALDEAMDEDLTLPIKDDKGKLREYVIKPCTADRWVKMVALQQVQLDQARKVKSAAGDLMIVAAESQRSILNNALGEDVVQRMIDDQIPAHSLKRAARTAMTYHLEGLEAAQVAWSGKAPVSTIPSDKDGDAASETPTDSTSDTSIPPK